MKSRRWLEIDSGSQAKKTDEWDMAPKEQNQTDIQPRRTWRYVSVYKTSRRQETKSLTAKSNTRGQMENRG